VHIKDKRKIEKVSLRMLSACDKRLGILRLQGVYLYDKGENDELFHVSVSSTDLQIYFTTL
jgi:hypothetical protein